MAHTPQTRYADFIAPRYWPTWIGLALLRMIHELLPYSAQLKVGKFIGRIFRLVARKRVHIAQVNLRLCFPELDNMAAKELLKRHFDALGMAIIETAMSWWGKDSEIRALADIKGLEHLKQAQKCGKGVILVTGHLTPMELAGHIISTYCKIGAMYRPLKNPLMDLIVYRGRGRRVQPLFHRDQVRETVRALKSGSTIWYGFDQNYGARHATFVPFFGVPAATITTTSRFAASGNALVIPFFPHREPGGRYRIRIEPPLEGFPSGDPEADTLRLNQLLEQAIRRHPEQYLWIHRRFKTRPPGSEPVY